MNFAFLPFSNPWFLIKWVANLLPYLIIQIIGNLDFFWKLKSASASFILKSLQCFLKIKEKTRVKSYLCEPTVVRASWKCYLSIDFGGAAWFIATFGWVAALLYFMILLYSVALRCNAFIIPWSAVLYLLQEFILSLMVPFLFYLW